jgi:hypothetical protein
MISLTAWSAVNLFASTERKMSSNFVRVSYLAPSGPSF